MSMTVLEKICSERDEVRSAAVALAESDSFDPEDKTFIDLQTRAQDLDKRASTLAGLMDQQKAADSLDAKLSKVQRRSDDRRGETRENLTWGEAWVRSEQAAQYPGRGTSQRLEVEMRALPHTLTSMADAMPSMPIYDLTPPAPPPSLLPLVNVINVSQNAVDYIVWALKAGAADIVPEGTKKPDLEWEPTVASSSLVTIAGLTSYSRQLAQDAAAVVSFINGELQREVSKKIEAEAQGALAAATLDTATGDDLISALRVGMAKVQAAGFTPNGFTVSADDLATMDIAAMAAGNGGPVRTASYWGLSPVIDWTKDAGDPITVGDFKSGVVHYRRTTVELFLTDSNKDHFELNVLDAIAEARCLTKVVRPAALVEVTAGP